MKELINRLNLYRSMGEKLYPEDILIIDDVWNLVDEIERLNNIINEIEKEIDRLLEIQYESERFAKEQGFNTYLPAKANLLCVKNKLQKLKGEDKE